MHDNSSSVATRRVAGAFFLIAGLLPLVCLAGLSSVFGYPSIIRADPGTIMARLLETQPTTSLLYYGVAGMGLFFALGSSLLSEHLSTRERSPWVRLVGTAGVVSGVTLIAGLLRWVRLFPELARMRSGGTVDPQLVDLVFNAMHVYLGETLGEHVQFTFTTVFLIAAGIVGARTRLIPRYVAWAAFPIAFVVFVGNLEFFGVPGVFIMNRIAAQLWVFWCIATGGCLLFLRAPTPSFQQTAHR